MEWDWEVDEESWDQIYIELFSKYFLMMNANFFEKFLDLRSSEY